LPHPLLLYLIRMRFSTKLRSSHIRGRFARESVFSWENWWLSGFPLNCVYWSNWETSLMCHLPESKASNHYQNIKKTIFHLPLKQCSCWRSFFWLKTYHFEDQNLGFFRYQFFVLFFEIIVLSQILKGNSIVLICGEQMADPHFEENQTKRVNVSKKVVLSCVSIFLFRWHIERSTDSGGMTISLNCRFATIILWNNFIFRWFGTIALL
jgi:hypothetical protein